MPCPSAGAEGCSCAQPCHTHPNRPVPAAMGFEASPLQGLHRLSHRRVGRRSAKPGPEAASSAAMRVGCDLHTPGRETWSILELTCTELRTPAGLPGWTSQGPTTHPRPRINVCCLWFSGCLKRTRALTKVKWMSQSQSQGDSARESAGRWDPMGSPGAPGAKNIFLSA
jgi:hypothetical protein